ncbi:MAG: reductive dehalogenase [Candidatus Bipolaricaulota bacterium]|nr:MAG: reductive dehalogenase [Candidatus Bipolaricaulota bacterium]
MEIRSTDAPYAVDESVYQQFDERRTIFMRRHWDTSATFYEKEYRDGAARRIAAAEPGYSRVEFAKLLASWTVHDCFDGAYSWRRLGQVDPAMMRLGPHEADDPGAMSTEVKRAASDFGADLVGICRVDPRWLYSHDRSGDPVRIPETARFAIVMGIAMDREAVLTSPAYASAAATGVGYSRMAFAIACMAQFLRNLRYEAIPMGNDTALSIPLAIDAGLGALGRNGLLVTPELGSCLRLCKVFTDLPLEPDRPIDFGLQESCRNCTRCAEACEGEAISASREPSYDAACASNSPGVIRWAVDADRCYDFWIRNTAACSNCIAACPYTRGATP